MTTTQTGRKATTPRNAPRVSDHVTNEELRAETQREPEHDGARVRKRRKSQFQTGDMFYIPRDQIPPGLDYEWKRWTNVGQEDPFYIARMREDGGWEPVPASRHPTWVPSGYKEPYIIKGGLILMDRPIELTEEARAEMRAMATRRIQEAERRLGKTPEGTMTREYHDSNYDVRPRIVKEMMRPMMVAEE